MNPSALTPLILLAYLLASVMFILGLKSMSSPKTAVRGNILGTLGMFVAIAATLLDDHVQGYWLIGIGLIAGGLIGLWLVHTVPMTGMP